MIRATTSGVAKVGRTSPRSRSAERDIQGQVPASSRRTTSVTMAAMNRLMVGDWSPAWIASAQFGSIPTGKGVGPAGISSSGRWIEGEGRA